MPPSSSFASPPAKIFKDCPAGTLRPLRLNRGAHPHVASVRTGFALGSIGSTIALGAPLTNSNKY
jgi:hypothetical protein